jgi:hypothetical protein
LEDHVERPEGSADAAAVRGRSRGTSNEDTCTDPQGGTR